MSNKFDKEVLFESYFRALDEVLGSFEDMFLVEGIRAKVFGIEESAAVSLGSEEFRQEARNQVRTSFAWGRLEALRDYAQDGLLSGDGDVDQATAVMEATEIIRLVTSELYGPSESWHEIVKRADARFLLDDGQPIRPEYVAILANVDVRTVRNAISSGELIAKKHDNGTFVEHSSARNWLHGRRGFTPTKIVGSTAHKLSEISTPAAFGAFLTTQKVLLGLQTDAKKFVPFHYAVDGKSLADLEAGSFRLPIDAAFPLADFYRVDRKEFLACVMRTFFPAQLSTIQAML